MKTHLQARMQQLATQPKFCHRNRVSGFTVLELLTVIVILGILSAIALPTFFRQANRAKEAEAKSMIGIINRAQQVYFLEHSRFGSLPNLDVLDLDLSNSSNYTYQSLPDASSAAIAALTTAHPKDPNIRGFAGKVWSAPHSSIGAVSLSILCEGEIGQTPQIGGTACP